MSKNRLLSGAVVVAMRRGGVGARDDDREREACEAAGAGQARVHHEVPGRLLLHCSSTPRRSGTRRRPARLSSTPVARAVRTTPVRSPRSRTWSPRASRASPSRRRARPCRPRSTRRSRPGVKVVLMDNDIPTWKKKSSVVATNNFKGGQLAGQVPRQEAEGGRHARRARGQSRQPGARRARDGHALGPRRDEEQDQGRLEARDRLRPDQGRDGGADDPDRESRT